MQLEFSRWSGSGRVGEPRGPQPLERRPIDAVELPPDECAELLRQRLVYIQSNGSEELRARIAALYPGASGENVNATNGSAEANFIAAWRVVEPGDEVVLVQPNYGQLWGVLRGFGAVVKSVQLREERGWGLDPDELARAFSPKTRMICVCNPTTRPARSSRGRARRDVGLAAKHGAWILAEVYRGAERDGVETPASGALRARRRPAA
jgi:aspartate/methionine/tyrosine aminotransferase